MIKKDAEFLKLLEELENLPDEESFRNYIKLFSNFLCQASEDYKYNETYLTQYVSTFYKFRELLLCEKGVFSELMHPIIKYSVRFELEVDGTFVFVSKGGLDLKEDETYIGLCKKINFRKLNKDKIEVKCRALINDKEKIFVREIMNEDGEKEKTKNELEEFLREGAGEDES